MYDLYIYIQHSTNHICIYLYHPSFKTWFSKRLDFQGKFKRKKKLEVFYFDGFYLPYYMQTDKLRDATLTVPREKINQAS